MTDFNYGKLFFDLTVSSTEARGVLRYIDRMFIDGFETILVNKHRKACFVILSPERFLRLIEGDIGIKFKNSNERAKAIEQLEQFLDPMRDTLLDTVLSRSDKDPRLVSEPGFRSR